MTNDAEHAAVLRQLLDSTWQGQPIPLVVGKERAAIERAIEKLEEEPANDWNMGISDDG